MWQKTLAIVFSLFLAVNPCFAGCDFDGVDDFASTAANNFLDSYNTGSVAFWVKFDSITDTNQYCMGSYSQATAEVSYQFNISDTGFVKLAWKCDYPGGNWAEILSSETDLTGNTGTHLIVFSADGTNQVKLYLDGSEETASYADGSCGANADSMDWFSDQNGIGSFNHKFTLGMWKIDADYNPFNGVIMEATIWSVGLTAAEVAHLYNAKIKGFGMNQIQPASVVEHWSIDEQEAGTSADGDTIRGYKAGNSATGDNGSNNTGLSWTGESILSYPPGIIGQ